MVMDKLNDFFSKKRREKQQDLVSECLLMASALKRHNEDATLLLNFSVFHPFPFYSLVIKAPEVTPDFLVNPQRVIPYINSINVIHRKNVSLK